MFSTTWEGDLSAVMVRLKEAGLTAKPAKVPVGQKPAGVPGPFGGRRKDGCP